MMWENFKIEGRWFRSNFNSSWPHYTVRVVPVWFKDTEEGRNSYIRGVACLCVILTITEDSWRWVAGKALFRSTDITD